MFKRGVSPVVATVLLLGLTVAMGSIIFAFVIPFVQEQLGNSKACLKVMDGVEFADSKFNCYVSTASGFETGFSFKVKKAEVMGVKISLIDENGNSDVKDFPDSVVSTTFRNIGGAYSSSPSVTADFPTSGGQRTYVTNKKYVKAEIAPMTESGDVCAVSDVVEFSYCSEDVGF